MKKKIFQALVFTCCISIFITACKKENENNENENCKTCRAFGTGSQPEVIEQVCGEDEQQAFFNQYAGREISCN